MTGGGSRPGRPWLAAGGGLLAAVLITIGGLWWGGDVQKVTAIVSALVGVAGLVVSLINLRRQRKQVTEADRAAALADFAGEVRRQWEQEARVRLLRRPAPIGVRWSATTRPVTASPAAVLGADAVPSGPSRLRLAGSVRDVAEKYRKLPNRQLVVLGVPGGGKTTLLVQLTLDLLAQRADDDPVPFLVNVAQWHPDQDLHDWLAGQLHREHRVLGDPAECRRFLADGRIIPVLDGFDELPEWHHQSALAAIDEAVDGGKPLILTCRTREYQDLLTRTGAPLANAAVIELQPVTAQDARAFLDHTTDSARWQPVLDRLRNQPDGPLAQALSTPLMVSLARTVYASPGADPRKLLTLPDRAAIEHQLLDAFIPSLYRDRDSRYSAADVVAWMSFLARYLDRWDIVGIAWWELHYALPPARRWLLLALRPHIPVGGAAGLVAGLLANHWFKVGFPPVLAMVAGLLLGGLAAWRSAPAPPKPVSKAGFRAARRSTLIIIVFPTAVVGLLICLGLASLGTRLVPPLVWASVPLMMAALGVAVWSFTYPDSLGDQPLDFDRDPDEVVRADRRYAWSRLPMLVWLAAVGLLTVITGLVDPARSTVGLFGLLVLYLCLAIRLWSASAVFTLTRWLLAADRRLPRDLLAFLHDAHQRGLLRRAGPFYEFRHALLQHHLAGGGRSEQH